MDNVVRNDYGRGFKLILGLFTFVYAGGVVFFLLSWLGVQSYDSLSWQPNSLPFFALVFLIGAVSAFGIWKRKKWGVYGLAATWGSTGVLNLVFVRPVTYQNALFALLLVVVFFLLLLPEWRRLDD